MMEAGASAKAALYRRILTSQNALLAPVYLSAGVLERYRGRPGFTLIRTNTIGRVQRQGSWTIDFGISPQEGTIHVSLGDLVYKLPEAERDHWTEHILAPPLSENFVKTQLAPQSCIDDGEIRAW